MSSFVATFTLKLCYFLRERCLRWCQVFVSTFTPKRCDLLAQSEIRSQIVALFVSTFTPKPFNLLRESETGSSQIVPVPVLCELSPQNLMTYGKQLKFGLRLCPYQLSPRNPCHLLGEKCLKLFPTNFHPEMQPFP